ncbi:Outer membrane lipoprotein SlyB [Massilia sp. Bi118]|uniref:glycine zipper 2TM domain-containing protein n=1 Tax=Massilia sp. Bi118 TaxID=2822346 RepID=UPI001D90CBA2|nr:glycine zipper 2TM domain-containing protein [Massilia sp. Bi118]CAH0305741.1 Outer membrane lipoprotein SlyB [Massilia sp. Bi118]
MNTHPTPPSSPTRRGQHPLLILAALAVILFCAVGTAAIMGWLPSSKGRTANGGLSDAERAALSASLQQPGAPAPGSMAPGALPPAYPAQPAVGSYVPATPSSTAPLPAMPPATIAPTTASTYPPGYVAQGGTTAYGSSAAGSTAAGYDEPAPVRESHPKARTTTRVAQAESSSNWCGNCGNVESIRQITTRAQGSGVGAAGGAILGGLLGNQVGSGHGRQLATVAGAVGGAVMGNQVEGNMKASHSYEIRVRLDDGTLRTFHQQSAPAWRTGDRVRIVKGALRAA